MSLCKRVNIDAPIAIRTITPPIHGISNNIIMSTGDILKCLCKRAIVDEILPDGTKVRLNMSNYYTDNGAGLDARVSNPINVIMQHTSPVNTVVLSNPTHTEEDDTDFDIEGTNNTPNNPSTENEPVITSGFINTNPEEDESKEYETTTSVTNEEDETVVETEEDETTVLEPENLNNDDKEESDDNSVNKETDISKESDVVKEDDSIPEKKEDPKKTSNSTNKKKSNNSPKKKINTSK